jgi:hypothetical protein
MFTFLVAYFILYMACRLCYDYWHAFCSKGTATSPIQAPQWSRNNSLILSHLSCNTVKCSLMRVSVYTCVCYAVCHVYTCVYLCMPCACLHMPHYVMYFGVTCLV